MCGVCLHFCCPWCFPVSGIVVGEINALKDGVISSVSQLKTEMEPLLTGVKDGATMVGSVAVENMSMLKSGVESSLGTLKSSALGVMPDRQVADAAIAGLSSMKSEIQAQLVEAGDAMASIGSGAMENVSHLKSEIEDSLDNLKVAAISTIPDAETASKAFASAANGAQTAITGVQESLGSCLDSAAGYSSVVAEGVSGMTSSLQENISGAISSVADVTSSSEIFGKVSDLKTNLVSGFGNLQGSAAAGLGNLGSSLWGTK